MKEGLEWLSSQSSLGLTPRTSGGQTAAVCCSGPTGSKPLVASLPKDTHVHAAYGLTHVHAIRNKMLKSWRQWNPERDQNVRNAGVPGWVLYFTCAVKTSSHTHMYSDSSFLVIKREKTLKKLRYPIHDQKIQKLFFHCWSVDSMPCQLQWIFFHRH